MSSTGRGNVVSDRLISSYQTGSLSEADSSRIITSIIALLLAVFGVFLHMIYARFVQIGSSLPNHIRKLIKNSITGSSVFLVHCIARTVYAVLTETAHLTWPGPYWVCALIESPYVIGFVVAAASNTISIAEHFRMSVLSFSTTMKSRQTRLERRHKRSIEKSIVLAWLLGILIAGIFQGVALTELAYLPMKDQKLPSMAVCSLIIIVPDPIIYSITILFFFLECLTGLGFCVISLYCKNHVSHDYTLHLNKAQTDLRGRFRMVGDHDWWDRMGTGILVQKGLTVVTIITAILVKYHSTALGGLMVSSVCTIIAQITLIVPLLVHMCRDHTFRIWFALEGRQLLGPLGALIRGLIRRTRHLEN